jgi:tetratricopeptide (TPR) repeat protein
MRPPLNNPFNSPMKQFQNQMEQLRERGMAAAYVAKKQLDQEKREEQLRQERNLTVKRKPLITNEDGRRPDSRFLMGLRDFRAGEFATAEKHFRDVVKHSPRNHDAIYYLGLSLEKEGRKNEAVGAFRTALRLNPEFLQARQKLAAYFLLDPKPQPVIPNTFPQPARKWSWYSNRPGDPEPPLLYKIFHWGCFALVAPIAIIAALGIIGMLIVAIASLF